MQCRMSWCPARPHGKFPRRYDMSSHDVDGNTSEPRPDRPAVKGPNTTRQNEADRATGERHLEVAEEKREAAEEQREAAEEKREVAEGEREVAEEKREVAECGRETDEGLRQIAEGVRSDADVSRQAAEETRLAAEQLRRNAEHVRQLAEGARDAAATAMVARDDVVTGRGGTTGRARRPAAATRRASGEDHRDAAQNRPTGRQVTYFPRSFTALILFEDRQSDAVPPVAVGAAGRLTSERHDAGMSAA